MSAILDAVGTPEFEAIFGPPVVKPAKCVATTLTHFGAAYAPSTHHLCSLPAGHAGAHRCAGISYSWGQPTECGQEWTT